MESSSFFSKMAGAIAAILVVRLSWILIEVRLFRIWINDLKFTRKDVLVIGFQRDLCRIPGPVLSRFTGMPLKIAVLTGRRSLYIHALHEHYGKCNGSMDDTVLYLQYVASYVRIAPREVHTADIEAFRVIHRIGSDGNKGLFYKGQSPLQTTDAIASVFRIRNNKIASPRRRLFQSAGTKKIVVEWEPQIREVVALALHKIKRDLREYGSLAFGESFHNTRNEKKNRLIDDIELLGPIIGLRGELPWIKPIMDFLPGWCPGSAAPLWDRFKAYGEDAVRATRRAQKGNSKTLFLRMVLEEGNKQAIPDSFIEKDAANFIVTGTDTTAIMLTYLVYTILRHPDVKEQLVGELNSCTTDPNWEELEKNHTSTMSYKRL